MEHSIFLMLAIICFLSFCSSQIEIKRRCNTAYSCSYEEKPVWATTTGQDCIVYRNGCHLLSANCDRINRDEHVAVPIGKEECQSFCEKVCPLILLPVCAFHNKDTMKTFGNQCEMENHICRTGLTFSIFRAEACPEHLEYPQ